MSRVIKPLFAQPELSLVARHIQVAESQRYSTTAYRRGIWKVAKRRIVMTGFGKRYFVVRMGLDLGKGLVGRREAQDIAVVFAEKRLLILLILLFCIYGVITDFSIFLD